MKFIKLSDKMYETLKWLCLIALPALAWGYSQLSDVWALPYGTEIPETINIVAFVLGCLIGVSTINYNAEKYNIEGAGYDDGESIEDDGEPAAEELLEDEGLEFFEDEPEVPEVPEEETAE